MKKDWTYKKLGEVCEVFCDGDWIESKDQSEDGIRLIQTGNVGNGVYRDKADKSKYISEETFKQLNCTEIFPGDILVSRLPDPIGRACIIPDTGSRMITAVDCSIIRLKECINPNLFVYYTRSDRYSKNIDKYTTGTTRKRISRSNLALLSVPIPSLEEQQQIVAELDLLSGMIEKQKAQIEELDKLSQSIFYDMFGDPVTNEKGWEVKNLKDIAVKIGSGATPRGGNQSYKDEGISLIRSMNVHNNLFVYDDLAFIDDEQATQLNNVIVEANDVLLNITGASVARCCIVPDDVLPARVNQHVCIIRPNTELANSIYLNRFLTSIEEQSVLLLLSRSNAATREALPKNLLENCNIVLPPLSLQQEFAAKIEAIEAMKAKVRHSLKEAETLFNSRMDYYFN